MTDTSWWIFQGIGERRKTLFNLPPPPNWRSFHGTPIELAPPEEADTERGAKYRPSDDELNLVNTAMLLRRPLLLTGKPGSGKSTLAYAIAHELNLGKVLHWPITTRTSVQDGLYRYDALGRFQDTSLHGTPPQIGNYIRLGPLGQALVPTRQPRVLLIDEIDKSDIDFPNNLLNIFEEGKFEIIELARLRDDMSSINVLPYDGVGSIPVKHGEIHCYEFPIVVMTSNGEREFPPAFQRRCLRLTIPQPTQQKLAEIVRVRLNLTPEQQEIADKLIAEFIQRRDGRDQQELATDQLLNAVYMVTSGVNPLPWRNLLDLLLRPLGASSDDEEDE